MNLPFEYTSPTLLPEMFPLLVWCKNCFHFLLHHTKYIIFIILLNHLYYIPVQITCTSKSWFGFSSSRNFLWMWPHSLLNFDKSSKGLVPIYASLFVQLLLYDVRSNLINVNFLHRWENIRLEKTAVFLLTLIIWIPNSYYFPSTFIVKTCSSISN